MAKAGVEVNGVGAAVPPLNADVLEKLVSAKEKNQSAFGPDRVDHDRGAAIPQSPASELQHLVLDHPLQDKIVLMMRGNLQNDPVAAAAPATIAIWPQLSKKPTSAFSSTPEQAVRCRDTSDI